MVPQNFLIAIATEHRVSKAELEVLSYIMQGESVGAIAKKINISEDAVRKRLSEVYHKFQISGRGPVKLSKLQHYLLREYQDKITTGNVITNTEGNATISTQQLGQHNNHKKPNSLDWDGAPDVSIFYGRSQEISLLNDWIINQNCRLVALLGMGGIGKTSLGVKLAQQIQEHFDYLVWRSLDPTPTLAELLRNLIEFLSQGEIIPQLCTVNQQISWVIHYLQSKRCLLILDGIESILSYGQLAGTYREGFENYGQFFSRIGEEPSRSCLLVTSREKIGEISFLEGTVYPVRSLRLEGLGETANLLLKEKGLSGEENWNYLIQCYRGNPLMLKLVAMTIQEVFDGDVTEFLSTSLFTHDVTHFVIQMLRRLSQLEEEILLKMAENEDSFTLKDLRNSLSPTSDQDLMRALVSLRQRALIEKSHHSFILPPIVREVTYQLVAS